MIVVNRPTKNNDCEGTCTNCGVEVWFYFSELMYYKGFVTVCADPRYWECPVCKTRNHDWKERK